LNFAIILDRIAYFNKYHRGFVMKIWVFCVHVSILFIPSGLYSMSEKKLIRQSKMTVQMPALKAAVVAGSADLVRKLLMRGAKPNVQDEQGWTPLHWAATMNNGYVAIVIIRLLVKFRGSVLIEDRQGRRPQDCAVNPTVKNFLARCVDEELVSKCKERQDGVVHHLLCPKACNCWPVEYWLADVEVMLPEEVVY
jgi:hypothetical protein